MALFINASLDMVREESVNNLLKDSVGRGTDTLYGLQSVTYVNRD
jgi:hypothetical protein